jgi:cyanophycinase-like exopeptidase
MDALVLQGAAPADRPVRVVVTALAGSPGRDAQTAEDNGVAHYRALGADAVAAPDARSDPDGALAALADADLVVLPGGSPRRLLDALRSTPVGAWLVEAVAAGTAVSGASAGAMVLCDWTVLPEGAGGPAVVRGLGIVPRTVVVPHWSGDTGRDSWLRAVSAVVPTGTEVLGLPEESGVLVADGEDRPVGRSPVQLVDAWRGDEEQDPLSSERPGGG